MRYFFIFSILFLTLFIFVPSAFAYDIECIPSTGQQPIEPCPPCLAMSCENCWGGTNTCIDFGGTPPSVACYYTDVSGDACVGDFGTSGAGGFGVCDNWGNCLVEVVECSSTCYGCDVAGCQYYSESCGWNLEGFCEPVETLCGRQDYCFFCYSQDTCETFGCTWKNNFCWWSPVVTTTDFLIFYNENSNFATPTDFMNNLVGFTAPFLENISGFLVSFQSIFDINKANSWGASIGQAVPTARGYLKIINDFFGGFPLSEIFIFYILIIVIVGVFRIVRILISLIKPV